MANKRKTTTAIVAGVTAVALLLGGTFAWTSISQRALNETAGIVNVGGRLHDDFNGKNKDIYVENFTDPLNGGQPIYARVKLTEYMEVGQEAGKLNDAGTAFDADRNAKSVIDGATIDNVDSWSVHKPVDDCAECQENGTLCKFHEHWKWEMGGKTTYMPTFNKDKDSLKADINGSYAGTNKTDKVYYDDYVVYTTDGTAEGVGKDIAEANKEAFNGSIYSVIGTEYYDDDTDNDDNGGTRQVGNVTHTAKETVEGTVILMKDWDGKPGDFWVYDTDGWAYWANPIMPGEATGLLLSNIDMFKNPGEKCYYSINVVGQFATVNDWEYFTDGGKPSDKALELLTAASGNVTTVTVTNNGETTLSPLVDEEAGLTNTTTFTATASKASDAATAAEDAFTWMIYDADLKPVTTSTIVDGKLTIGENEINKNLIIAATHVDSGAVGLASVAVKLPDRTPATLTHEYERYGPGSSTGKPYAIITTISDIDETDYPLTVEYYCLENTSNDIPEGEAHFTKTIEDPTVNTDRVGLEVVTAYTYIFVKVTDAKGNVASFCSNERLEYLQGCFVAGTQVQTVNGPVDIEAVQAGDKVYSVDLTTGEKVTATVSWVQEQRFIDATYTVRAGGEEIVTTYEHPFYVVGKEWVAAEELEAGDKLLTGNGEEVVIDEIIYTALDKPIQVYNFEVEKTHCYLVGENGFIVHNPVK